MARNLCVLVFGVLGVFGVCGIVVFMFRYSTHSAAPTNKKTSSTTWQSNTLVERNKSMYNNSYISDIKITFGSNRSGEVLYAHKYVLATSSPIFYEMLYGKSGENITDIYLLNSDNETVAAFFGFLYEDKCPTATNVEKGLKLLRLVMEYQVSSFDTACESYLEPTPLEAFQFLENFLETKADRYINTCLSYIDTCANQYFVSEYFFNIRLSTLIVILQRDTIAYDEVRLFKAVVSWVDHQCSQQNFKASRENRRKLLGNAIYNIRFLLMTLYEFSTDVIAVDILDDHESIGIIKEIAGHGVPDLMWGYRKLRRQRSPNKWNWWTIFKGVLFTITCGFIVWLCLVCLERSARKARLKQLGRRSKTQ